MENGKIMPSYDRNRQILGKILPLETPFNVIIDSSEACNFRCNYCFRSDGNKEHWGYARDNQLMKWDIFEQAVEQIREFPQEVKQISLSNHGEPLANRKLPDMVRYIKQKGIGSRVSIHTNASLLDEEYVYDLADSGIDRIVVSLQGLTAEKYKQVCGMEVDYEKFYGNLMLLYRKKRNTQIHVKIADVALGEGEEETFFGLYEPIADRVFIEQAVPIWNHVDIPVHSGGQMKNKYGECFPKQECCPLIFHTIVVVPGGDVYPCTQLLQKEKLGNIQGKKLLELWNSRERKEMLSKQCRLSVPELCKGCGIRQNSIYAKEDMIDSYREKILERLEK